MNAELFATAVCEAVAWAPAIGIAVALFSNLVDDSVSAEATLQRLKDRCGEVSNPDFTVGRIGVEPIATLQGHFAEDDANRCNQLVDRHLAVGVAVAHAIGRQSVTGVNGSDRSKRR